MESILPRFSLTQKQQAVYDFIQSYFVENRRSPLIREIQNGCQIVSYKSAIDRLNTLERKGYIRRAPNKHRGIKLFKRAASPPSPELATAGPAATGGAGQPPSAEDLR